MGTSNSEREIRLAFVLYGGVSLAVYMHGVCREIQEVMKASDALGTGTENDLGAGTSAHAYAALLKQRTGEGTLPVRVVTDTIAGTSAGGIDGIYLAKALAGDLSQRPLRDLWIIQGDIRKLLKGVGPVWLRLLWFAGKLVLRGDKRAPLRGGWMTRRLLHGLELMDASGSRSGGRGTLIAQDQTLDLFVTITDGKGYERYTTVVPGGHTIRDTTHRHVLHFRSSDSSQGRGEGFGPSLNHALTFAARATSSFPGAFPVVKLDEFAEDLKTRDQSFNLELFASEFFPEYVEWNDDPRRTWFIDGGVLDNFPFDPAIACIDHKPAGSEVERHLIYVEPHPRPDPPAGTVLRRANVEENPNDQDPGWFQTILAAISGIPSHEPILDDIMSVRERNERIARIRSLARDRMPDIMAEVGKADQWKGRHTDYPAVRAITDSLHDLADQRLGVGLETYESLRLQDVAQRLSDVIAAAFAYPATSSAAAFIRESLNLWLPTNNGKIGNTAFLRRYDIPFRERRIAFVIQGLNARYTQPLSTVERLQTDALKKILHNQMQRLWDIPGRMGRDLKEDGKELFAPDHLTQWLDRTPKEFAETKHSQLVTFLEQIGIWLDVDLQGFGNALWIRTRENLESWPEKAADDVLGRYLGFPLWDGICFPLVALSEVHQSTQINVDRISPLDATALKWSEPKLKGTEMHNFAAFFKQGWRENDYIWGRLDAAEFFTKLIGPPNTTEALTAALTAAFNAVLNEEDDLPILTSPGPDSFRSKLKVLIDGIGTNPQKS